MALKAMPEATPRFHPGPEVGLGRAAQLGGLLLFFMGTTMVLLNPKQPEYEDYATETLTTYLKEEACIDEIPIFGGFLKTQCAELVQRNRGNIQQFIAGNTVREDYFFFSLYRTRLSLTDQLPSYEFETLGIYHRFHTYRKEKL